MLWNKLISYTGNTHYDPVTHTINWSADQWEEYVQKNPDASKFRYKPLPYADELMAIFGGMGATGKDAWGPSKQGLPTEVNEISKKSFINLETDQVDKPSSSTQLKIEKKNEAKRQKKSSSEKSNDLDNQLMAVLKTLEQSDGPSIEDCSKILDEMKTLEMTDELYVVAASLFCEGKAYRGQWIHLSTKPEEVQKAWIAINGKKLGFL